MAIIHTIKTEQPGGWFSIQIISLEELVYCPPILTNINSNSIVIVNASEILDVLPVGETIKIDEPVKITKSGAIYTIKGEFEFAKQSSSLDTFLNKYQGKKVVMIGTKHDGQRKLYGSKRFPLEFIYEQTNGKKYEDGNQTIVSVEGKTPQKPVFMNG